MRNKGLVSVKIRYAKESDLDVLAELSVDAIISSIPKRKMWLKNFSQKARKEEYRTLKMNYRFSRDNLKVLVAELGGEIIGYLVMMLGVRDSSTGYPHAWIFDLYVKPEYRGKGLAKRLMRLAEDIAKREGYRYIGLTVTSENLTAYKLYEKLGYVEERKIMVKELREGNDEHEEASR